MFKVCIVCTPVYIVCIYMSFKSKEETPRKKIKYEHKDQLFAERNPRTFMSSSMPFGVIIHMAR